MPNSCWIDGRSGENPRFDSCSANIATSVTTNGSSQSAPRRRRRRVVVMTSTRSRETIAPRHARAVRIPRARIDDVALDRQHRNAGVLERALDEQAARAAAGFMLRGRSTSAPSIRCSRAWCDDPLGRPRRIVQVLVEARRPAGQCGHRIVEAVADVAVGPERQIHRPDEHGAMRRLERRVEVRVVPQARTDPHQPRAFARDTPRRLRPLAACTSS